MSFSIQHGRARLVLTFTPAGDLETAHEYDGVRIKRVGVRVRRANLGKLIDWISHNHAKGPADGESNPAQG